ncbi:hypothetical protein N9Y89_02510 [bacterium]|nr:hypothetical protein [bacterium]
MDSLELQSTPIGRGRGFRYGFPNDEYYFKSQEEMKILFKDIPENKNFDGQKMVVNVMKCLRKSNY